MMNIKIFLEKSDDGGYTIIVPSLPGCISEGEPKEQAIENIREAIELYLEPVEDEFLARPEKYRRKFLFERISAQDKNTSIMQQAREKG